MKDQVTSIEQSKKLLELGVPAEMASMSWATPIVGDTHLILVKPTDPILKQTIMGIDHVDPAFTVADLLGLLPESITIEDGVYKHEYHVEISKKQGEYVMCYYIEEYDDLAIAVFPYFFDSKLVNVVYDMVEWLVSNGYDLNV